MTVQIVLSSYLYPPFICFFHVTETEETTIIA